MVHLARSFVSNKEISASGHFGTFENYALALVAVKRMKEKERHSNRILLSIILVLFKVKSIKHVL